MYTCKQRGVASSPTHWHKIFNENKNKEKFNLYKTLQVVGSIAGVFAGALVEMVLMVKLSKTEWADIWQANMWVV